MSKKKKEKNQITISINQLEEIISRYEEIMHSEQDMCYIDDERTRESKLCLTQLDDGEIVVNATFHYESSIDEEFSV